MLFNKDNNGSKELQQLTGSFPASNDYSVIRMEVDDAIRTVRGLVGGDVVDKAETLYEAGTEDGLVAAVRMPVAILAVARYSRNNLVSHDASGSKVKVDANERMPWEWMVDRDERAQQDRWYRALDALYAYLTRTELPEWTRSDAYKRQRRSIVRTLDEMEAVYPLDGSYYVYYLLQNLVVECQGRLRKMIGEEQWSLITADAVADDVRALLCVCQRWAVLTAVVTAVRRWSLEVFPLSIVRRFCPSWQGGRSQSAATLEEMEAYVDALEDQIYEARTEMAELLADKNPWEAFALMPENDPANKFFTAQ